jgi:hypothetical protein
MTAKNCPQLIISSIYSIADTTHDEINYKKFTRVVNFLIISTLSSFSVFLIKPTFIFFEFISYTVWENRYDMEVAKLDG